MGLRANINFRKFKFHRAVFEISELKAEIKGACSRS